MPRSRSITLNISREIKGIAEINLYCHKPWPKHPLCHYGLESLEVVLELWFKKSMRDPGCLRQEWQQHGNLTPSQSIASFPLQSRGTVRQGFTYCSSPHPTPPKKLHFYNTFKLIAVYISILSAVFSITCDEYFKLGQKA